MKMTPLLWRVVSVCLCVAVIYRYPSCYVECSEQEQDAQRALSSQDIGSEEEMREKSLHHEDSRVLSSESPSEHEQLVEEEEQTTQEGDDQQHLQEAVKVLEAAVEEEVSPPEPEPEQSSEETFVTEDQDSASLLPSSEHVSTFTAELQDNVAESVSDDPASAEAVDPDLPPADCEEEEQNNPFDNVSSPPLVLENPSNVHTTGTKSHTDPPLTSLGSQHLEANASLRAKEQDSPATTGTDSSVSSKDPEDIPTFDEWTRKMMEVENEKTQSTHTSNNGASHVVKKVQKNFNNYASVECGAKILGANPEAKGTSAILKENMDVYMLNPCSNKIWFIIELCEPIQVKQLDIANFELFSSTPRDFLVSISDRYPTNKWLKLGTFHARDERTVQTFPLDEHLYAKYVKMFTKYIKVELVSHFGSEHFCPLSLIRVFGTSMVEEYEEIADPSERPDDQDDDLDYPPGYSPGEVKSSKNLIGSAKDVILNMVNNIAVNVLGGGPEMPGNLSSQDVNMSEPPAQPEAATTDFTLVPASEAEQTFPDVDVPAAAAPSSEEAPADAGGQELPPVEEKHITLLDREEEEHISSTITLLEEEELDEGQEKLDQHERHKEIQNCCSLLASFSSSCSCVASLQEYLLRQCSALLCKKRRCQAVNRKQMIPPIQTPVLLPAPPPSAGPEHEAHPPHEQEHAAEQEPAGGASVSETSPSPPGNTVESHTESLSEPSLLEPSQTSNLPSLGATDAPSAKPTPIVETPQLSSEEPAREPKAEKSQDVMDERMEEQHSGSIHVKPTVSAAEDDVSVPPAEEKSHAEVSLPDAPIQTPDTADESQALHPTASPHLDLHPDSGAAPEGGATSSEAPHPAPDAVTDLEPSGPHSLIADTKSEDFPEDLPVAPGVKPSSPSLSDIYAEPPNGTEQNGNPVHGSSQKESVFMRLNNRIKALEMNMSLSGRYLEQLSQRYRKQMEEMQRAFNKTIIKLQNTSRIAEEQDQRQTESIQSLQVQLENITQLVLNLSVRVSQLQHEVSDRQNYLLLSLLLCLCFGLLICTNQRRVAAVPPATEPEPPTPKSYTYCCPERQLSCDETGLKRSASYPLIHSLGTNEGPEMLQAVETQSLCPLNRKRRRRKIKPMEKAETMKPLFYEPNGAVLCNGVPVTTNPIPLAKRLLQPMFRDSPSEGSSEGSSHSDDPSFCGIATACTRICDGLPPPKTRAEKRALRRRRPKPGCTVVDLLQVPRRKQSDLLPISTIQDLMSRRAEQSSGTFGVNVALSGPV